MKILVLTLLVSNILLARPIYMNQFKQTYPETSGEPAFSCTLCHRTFPGSPMNDYGKDYVKKRDFLAIEDLDSDGDGFTNIEEIQSLTLPGNSKDFPEQDLIEMFTDLHYLFPEEEN